MENSEPFMTEISIDNKRIAKNTVFLYIRQIVSLLIGLYASRVTLQVLGVTDYGVYNVIAGFVTMLIMFSNFFTSSTTRFITYALALNDKKMLCDTFSTIVNIITVGALFVLIVGGLLSNYFLYEVLVIPSDRLDAAYWVLICAILVFVLRMIIIPYEALVISHERMDFFAIVNTGESVLKLGVVVLLQFIGGDHLVLYAVLLTVVVLIVRVVYGIYCRIEFEESKYRIIIDKKISKEMLPFSFFAGLSSFTGIIRDQSGNIILNIFYGVLLNAARGIGQQLQGVVGSFANNLGQAVNPQIIKSYANGDHKRAVSLTLFSVKVQGYLMFFLMLPLMIETKYLLELWLGEAPDYSIQFSQLSLLLGFSHIMSNSCGILFIAIGHMKKFSIVSSLIFACYLPLCYFCYYLGTPPSTMFYVGILNEIVAFIVAFYMITFLIEFPIRKFYIDIIFKMILIFVLSLLPSLLINKIMGDANFFRLVVNILCSWSVLLGLMYIFSLEYKEKKIIYDLICRSFKRN